MWLDEVGGLPSICRMLSSSSSPHLQQNAADATCFLSSRGTGSTAQLQAEGLQTALPALILCLSSEDSCLRDNAAGALAAMARHEINHAKLISLQGHFRLLKLLATDSCSRVAQHSCLTALVLLAKSGSSSQCFMEASALKELSALLTAPKEQKQVLSLELLTAIFSGWWNGSTGPLRRLQHAKLWRFFSSCAA